MECPKEFTMGRLDIADVLINIPNGDLIYPYVEYLMNNFQFVPEYFDKNMVSNNNILLLSLHPMGEYKTLEVRKIDNLIGANVYLTVYDAKKISRLIKLKTILEV
jgi:hypothetical protein